MIDYRIIDLNTYPRRAHLEYFMTMMLPQLSITAEVDVTELKQFCEKQGCSFFLGVLHVVALSADSIPQFRQRIHRLLPKEMMLSEHAGFPKEGSLNGLEIREYVQSPTSHTEAAGDEMYCYCTVHHHMPWNEYIVTATELQKKARQMGALKEDDDVEAFYFATCIPWVHYSDVVHPIADRFDSNPRISWGKYAPDFRERLMMPLTVVVHHGLVDGIHVGRFYENVENNIKALIGGKLD